MSGSMRAAVLTGFGRPLDIAEQPIPTPGHDDVVLRVDACGICRSDWHVWSGDWAWRFAPPFPHILGHETVGVITARGRNVRRVREGERVTVPFHLSCDRCAWCRAGRSNLCDTYTAIGFQLPGAFAEYVRVPLAERNVVPLPPHLSALDGASLGCRLTSAFHGLERAGVVAGEWVAVFGTGGVGLSAIHLASALGARCVGIDVTQAAAARARAAGAEHTAVLNADDRKDSRDILDQIITWTDGGPAVTVDAIGSEDALAGALHVLRRGGRHLQLGLTGARERGMLPVAIDRVVKAELTLLGAVGCPRDSFERLIELTALGIARPGSLVTRTVPLAGISDVLAAMSDFSLDGMVAWSPLRGDAPPAPSAA
jgi:D-arabinose 1-dehydrogenase-like Zn-dependent alcohol dehydrogenase